MSETRPFCYPVCFPCRVAECPKAIPIPQPQIPRWPDSLAEKVMACGCRTPIIPTVLGLLNPTHVQCVTHGWQPLPERATSEGKQNSHRGKRGARPEIEGQETLESGSGEFPF